MAASLFVCYQIDQVWWIGGGSHDDSLFVSYLLFVYFCSWSLLFVRSCFFVWSTWTRQILGRRWWWWTLSLTLFVCLFTCCTKNICLPACLSWLLLRPLSDQLGQVGSLGGGRGGGLFVTVTRGLAAFRILIGSHLPYCTGFDTMLNNLYPLLCNNVHCTRIVQWYTKWCLSETLCNLVLAPTVSSASHLNEQDFAHNKVLAPEFTRWYCSLYQYSKATVQSATWGQSAYLALSLWSAFCGQVAGAVNATLRCVEALLIPIVGAFLLNIWGCWNKKNIWGQRLTF